MATGGFVLSGMEEIAAVFMRSRGIASRVIEIVFGWQDAGGWDFLSKTTRSSGGARGQKTLKVANAY